MAERARIAPAASPAIDEAPARADDLIRLGPLADFIGFHLRLAQEASFRAFAQRSGCPGIKPSRFAIMTLIAENPGLSQTTLGRAAGRDKSTLTTALDDLTRRGLVQRDREPTDRRSYRLHLTAKGEEVLAELMERAREHDRLLDSIVGPHKKPELIRLLARIAADLG
ncbi:MarR family winged helix-turn-helix transcriptional regulator [Phreatobacter sp.]|uniref:MarR family winged helix-turn-helix transcriptional regulator n=1 Tax=Phreatobacter sp. TaxID=1966341 RepID=UPI003F725AA7